MTGKIEPIGGAESTHIDESPAWDVDYYSDLSAYDSVEEKLRLVQTILENGWVTLRDTWRLQSLGGVFGDALVPEVPELIWATVQDEFSIGPALCWTEASTLVFPLTAISKRVEDHINSKVQDLSEGFEAAIREAVSKSRRARFADRLGSGASFQ